MMLTLDLVHYISMNLMLLEVGFPHNDNCRVVN